MTEAVREEMPKNTPLHGTVPHIHALRTDSAFPCQRRLLQLLQSVMCELHRFLCSILLCNVLQTWYPVLPRDHISIFYRMYTRMGGGLNNGKPVVD